MNTSNLAVEDPLNKTFKILNQEFGHILIRICVSECFV